MTATKGAFAADAARAPLPGGGSVELPARYKPVAQGDYNYRDVGALVAYRHYRSMMSGTSECDGMIAVARAAAFGSVEDFVRNARGALTTRWSYADGKQSVWYGKDERFPVESREGPNGVELGGVLSVHMVGFIDVYDKPARFFAVDDRRGVKIAVWIFESHGGESSAMKIADAIAASFSA